MRNRVLLMFALALAWAGIASAQESTSGSITGLVIDAQGATIPGATVTVTSAQGSRSFVSDSNGRFYAPFLTPGTYSVKVELTGFSTVEQKNIEVRLGARLEMKFSLTVGQVTETIEVVGAPPTVDLSSTTVGGTLDAETLKRLPLGRNFTDSLYLVPGVSDSSGLGRANPSIAGGSGLENNYVVDGVNITDTGFGAIGAYNSSYGSLGSGVTSDFVKETQVKTGGFEAEYGQATGGVVNVVTKSGGNEFHGSVFGFYRPESLEASWKDFQAQNGIVNTTGTTNYDVGASLGGPLIKDKLFFFGTYNPQWQQRQFIAPEPSTLASGATVVFPFRTLGSVERKRTLNSYAGKLSFQASSNHRFDLSVFGDPSTGNSGLQRSGGLRRVSYPGAPGIQTIDGGFSELKYGGNSQTLRYDGIISPKWLIEASVAHSSNKFDETPSSDTTNYVDTRFVPRGTTGGLGFWENNDGKNTQLSLKSTNIFEAAGNHHLRYGGAMEDIKFTRDTEYSGQNSPLADGQNTITGVLAQIRTAGGATYYRATRGKLRPTGETTQKYYNAFIQDTWQMGRLTLRPGIRWERQHLQGVEGQGLCHADDTRPGANDGTGAEIACNYTWNNLWAPRIGGTFDLTGNGKAKLYGSWGKFYAKIPNDLAARAMSADAGITRQDYYDSGLTQPIANGVSFGGTSTHLLQSSGSASIIDPKAGSTYTNEYIGGIEFEVARNVSIGARYIHRTLPQILEDIGQLAVVGYFLDACGDTTVDYFITNVNAQDADRDLRRRRPRVLREPGPQVRRHRVHDQQELLPQLGADRVLPLRQAEGKLRGLLPLRQRSVGSLDQLALRLPHERCDLHGDRRTRVRLQRRHPLPGHDARRGRASQRPAAPGQGVRQLRVGQPEPGPRLQLGFRTQPHEARRQPGLRERRRDPGDAPWQWHLDGRRVADEDGGRHGRGPACGLRVQARQAAAPRLPGGRVQPAQPPGGDRLRQLGGVGLRDDQPQLRSSAERRRRGQPLVPSAHGRPSGRPVRVVVV